MVLQTKISIHMLSALTINVKYQGRITRQHLKMERDGKKRRVLPFASDDHHDGP